MTLYFNNSIVSLTISLQFGASEYDGDMSIFKVKAENGFYPCIVCPFKFELSNESHYVRKPAHNIMFPFDVM